MKKSTVHLTFYIKNTCFFTIQCKAILLWTKSKVWVVYDWIFANLAGIDICDDGAGYSHITVSPKPDKRVGFLICGIKTKYGTPSVEVVPERPRKRQNEDKFQAAGKARMNSRNSDFRRVENQAG